MDKKNLFRPSLLVIAGLLMAAGLAGCDQKKEAAAPAPPANALALPLTKGPATAIVPAPSAASLPAAARPRIAQVANQSDNYAYIDRAYEMSDAIGQAPPDYGFDYEGVHPWTWRSSNGDLRLIEPIDGGYRYYYYQPGATEPYLVRDPQYSYGFSDGQLVAVYDQEGRLLPSRDMDQRIDDAGRYLARAASLYRASEQSERRRVNAANWAERRAELDAARSRWEAEQAQQQAWRAYHAQHEAEEQSYWQRERDQRNQSARSFNNWSSRGFDGPPPPPVSYAHNVDQALPAGDADSSGNRHGDLRHEGQPAQTPAEINHQDDAARQGPPQTGLDQARAQQAQAKAAADAAAHAQQQKAQADAARAQQQAQADAVRQSQAKAAAAQQAQAKAAADAAAHAQQQKAQADAVHAQQQAQADAVRQSQAKAAAAQQAQAKAAADAAAHAQQQKAQADAARRVPSTSVRPTQGASSAPAQTGKARDDAHHTAAQKALDDSHHRDDASGKPPP